MNRSARVASTATTGQVLCSSETWLAAKPLMEKKANATSLGQFRLKVCTKLDTDGPAVICTIILVV